MASRSLLAGALVLTLTMSGCGKAVSEPEPSDQAPRQTRSLVGRMRSAVVTAGAIDVGAPSSMRLLGGEWHSGEGNVREGWRAWANSTQASLWMVVEQPEDSMLWVRAAPPAFMDGQTLAVEVGGKSLGEQRLKPGMQWLAFPVRANELKPGNQRFVLRAGQAQSQKAAGAGADERVLSFACEWVLLTPRAVQPAKRVAELRERESLRASPEGWQLLPGDFVHLPFQGSEVDEFVLRHSGGKLNTEVVDRATGRVVPPATAEAARPVTYDLRSELAPLALNLAVPSSSEPVLVERADATGPPRPWNLVLVIVDTLRADAVLDPQGAYETPELDRLAADSIVFPETFAHAPMTLPSHTALFSSSLPHSSGVVNNWQEVSAEIPLLSPWLARYGYGTSAVLSLGTLWNEHRGTSVDRGFEVYDTSPEDMAKAPFTEDRLRRAVDALDPSRPFFLFAHFSDPHEPYNSHRDSATDAVRTATLRFNGEELATVATSDMTVWKQEVELAPGRNEFEIASDDEFFVKHLFCRTPNERLRWKFSEGRLRRAGSRLVGVVKNPGPEAVPGRLNLWIHDVPERDEQRERYRQEVEFVDRSIGGFLAHLEGHGLLDESIVVFTSDHGEALGERDSWGHVETLKDEMLHVPLFIRLPAGHPGAPKLRARTGDLVRHVDLVPTMLELLDLPGLPRQEGTSLLTEAERVLISETRRPEATRDKVCLRDQRFKMIYTAADEQRGEPAFFEMYDLVQDPGELVDVFEARRSERPDWAEALEAVSALYSADNGEVPKDPDQIERLKALGYMQHEEGGE